MLTRSRLIRRYRSHRGGDVLGCSSALVSLLVSACVESGTAANTALERDSAGVTIVENAGPIWDEETAWRVEETPAVEIGGHGVPPQYDLFEVRAALRLNDGRIVVANSSTAELRYYGPTGEFEYSVGREGGGPGEFGNIYYLLRFGPDSLIVWDTGNGRFSVHDRDGVYSRVYRLRGPDGAPFFPGMHPVVFDDRTMLGMGRLNVMDQPEGIYRPLITYLRFDQEGESIGPVVKTPFRTFHVKRGEGDRVAMAPIMFGPESYLTPSAGAFWLARGETDALERYDAAGRLVRIVRNASYEPPRVEAAYVEAERESRLADLEAMLGRMPQASPEFAAAARANIRELPFAETFPPHAGLLADTEGNVWVKEYMRPGRTVPRWTVFSARGMMLGTLHLPERFEIMDVGGNYVLGLWKDELDVEYVRLYHLLKP